MEQAEGKGFIEQRDVGVEFGLENELASTN